MKRLTTLAAALLVCGAAPAQERIPGTDSRVTVTGRGMACGDTLRYDWSGTSVRVKFLGKTLKMVCADSGADWFNVFTDKDIAPAEDSRLKVSGGEFRTVTLFEGRKKGEHEIILQKRTEGEQGTFSILAFETDGRFLQAGGQKGRHIEFVGDSYTCGYGTEASGRDEPFRPEEENANLTYASILGRYFDAGVNLVSHSGRGITRNYGDGDPGNTMPVRYLRTLDGNPSFMWDPSSAPYKPDIVVIYLGTNDFSTGRQPLLESWLADYKGLLQTIRSWYGPDVPVLCAAAPSGREMGGYVEKAARECGLPNVHWMAIESGAYNMENDLGASWHPNYGGQRKVASSLAPYIATLTGWELPSKILE